MENQNGLPARNKGLTQEQINKIETFKYEDLNNFKKIKQKDESDENDNEK